VSPLRHGRPLWLDRAPANRRKYPRHKGTLSVDVAIIGGGTTGAVAAYVFSKAGVSVAVLEANRVAFGSTAASTSLLMQEPDRDLADLSRRYGRRAAHAVWRSLAVATRDLQRTLTRLRIDCELEERTSVYYTLDSECVPRLRKEYDQRRKLGLPGRWLDAKALYNLSGIKGQAAIATPGDAQLNPVRACLGLLEAAAAHGARIFEHSPVRRIESARGGVVIHTSGGTVHADRVVIATGYARTRAVPSVGRFRFKDTFVLGTRRVPKRLRRALLSARAMAWDAERPYHFMRWADRGRLLVGGEDRDRPSRSSAAKRLAWGRARLLKYLGRVYPPLAAERPEYVWEGVFAETPDGLPYIGTHSRYPGYLFALCYGGNGMTASYLAATVLLNQYRELRDSRESLFAFDRYRRS
jgi:glycine/D-amino acid oxidase-like deaminating enzyme